MTPAAPSPFRLEPGGIACPAPFYEDLRRDAPVTFVEEVGAWVVSRYSDVLEVARQPELYSNRYPTGPLLASSNREAIERIFALPSPSAALQAAGRFGRWRVLFNVDPPEHTRHRSLVNRAFTPREVAKLEPEIHAIADRLIDGFVDRGEVEIVSSFAVPLPVEVIARRFGVPDDAHAAFKQWSDDFTATIGNHVLDPDELVRTMESQGSFYLYFLDRIAQERAHPGDNMLAQIVTAELEGGVRLTDEEILGMLSQFLVAGNETTTNLLASAALLLASHPKVASALRADPERIPAFVEEVLRLEAPSQGMFRLTREDVTIGGVDIPARSHVFLAYASCNRDGDAFEHPDAIDLERTAATPHLAFGRGTHFCLGAPLARQEARVGLRLLLDRLDAIELGGPQPIAYHASYFLHGPKAVHLRFARR